MSKTNTNAAETIARRTLRRIAGAPDRAGVRGYLPVGGDLVTEVWYVNARVFCHEKIYCAAVEGAAAGLAYATALRAAP